MTSSFLPNPSSRVLLNALRDVKGTVGVSGLSQLTCIAPDDIVSTLQYLNLVKYWKGQHVICVTPKIIEELLQTKFFRAPKIVVDPSCLRWTPPVFTSSAGKDKRKHRD